MPHMIKAFFPSMLANGGNFIINVGSAWQQISVLGHNLLRSFQLQTLATQKLRSRKRTYGYLLHSLKTIRFKLIHQPARIVKPQGYSVLRFSVAPPVQKLIESIEAELKLAA